MIVFKHLIRKARSTRRFDAACPIDVKDLISFIDLARLTPSAGNQQSIRYRVVHDAECDAIFPHIRWAAALKDWSGPEPSQRPTGYIVLATAAGKIVPEIDLGIAAMTMQLAATASGGAACMLGAFDANAIGVKLGLPDSWTARLVMAFGIPDETIELVEGLPDGKATAYWRDSRGKHYVPKRTLREVLLPAPE